MFDDYNTKTSTDFPQSYKIDKEERIRLRISRMESRCRKAYETTTWQFQRTWGRLAKMLYHVSVSLLLYIALFPIKIYCKIRGLSLWTVTK